MPAPVLLELKLLQTRLAIVRLPADASLPDWFPAARFRSATWTNEELSIVCEETCVPADARAERDWRGFMLQGPFDFELTGILLAVLEPLARAGIGIFAMSTFDTDYVLVKQTALQETRQALLAAGHRIIEADAA